VALRLPPSSGQLHRVLRNGPGCALWAACRGREHLVWGRPLSGARCHGNTGGLFTEIGMPRQMYGNARRRILQGLQWIDVFPSLPTRLCELLFALEPGGVGAHVSQTT